MNKPTDAGVDHRAKADRAEQLLRCYPSISNDEAQEIIEFLKHGQIMEVGRVSGLPELRKNIEDFRGEHRRAFSLAITDYLKFMLIAVMPVALLVWFLWDRGAK